MEMREFIDLYNLDENVIILEPQEDFNRGIIGVSEDKKHLIYSYEKLTCLLAQEYKNFEHDNQKTNEDYLFEACEWVDYNTLRAISSMNQEYAPIIIYEVNVE